MFAPSDDDDYEPPARLWWPRRLSRRVMDWLWHGLLTRDLRPARPPSQFRQAISLLADLCRMAVSYVTPERDRQ